MQLFVKDKKFYIMLLSIAAPIALQGLIMFGVNMADTVMLGTLGEVSLSGAALANQFCFIFQIMNFGLGGGAGVLTGQFWGKGDKESIGKTISIVLKLTTLFGLLFFLLAQFIPEVIIGLYTTEQEVIEQGSRYLRIISFSFVFQGISTISIIILRTVGVLKLTLITTMVTLANNIFLNWVFIYGNLGAPTMETAGAALATAISRIIEFAIVVIFLLKIDHKIKFKLPLLLKLDKTIFRNYISHGTPVLISDLFLALGMNMLSVVLGRMGSDVVAANAINGVLWQLTAVLLMGIASSSGIITGNTVGAGKLDEAQEYGTTFVLLSIVLGLCAGVAIFFLKHLAVDLYNISENTRNIAYQLMNTMSIISVFSAISFTLTKGVLRAGGDTKFLMIADVLFLWVLSVPLGFVAGIVLKLPPGIVFFCLKIDEVIKAMWCLSRLTSRKWIKNIALSVELEMKKQSESMAAVD